MIERLSYAGWPGVVTLALALGSVACVREREDSDASRSASIAAAGRQEELLEAADRIVAFLRGAAELPAGAIADTVVLLLAPAGGNATVSVAGGDLHSRARWEIATDDGRVTYSLLPPTTYTVLTKVAGKHLNCFEQDLDQLYPELASHPHVGTMLKPPAETSCLQSWNLTLVFDDSDGTPVLRAAVYDQWEW